MLKMKKRILLVIISMLFVSMSSTGQTSFGVTGTQAGSSNGSANNVSNDLFTGTANISIPLVAKTVDGVDLGVNISYNTRGIKLDDVSSVVGLGWNLSYGGTISRVIRGLPDDFVYKNAAGYFYNQGYWFRTNDNIPNYTNTAKHMGTDEAMSNIGAMAVDGQMDIFTLVVNGMKVDFMINANNEVQTIPNNSRIKIQRTFGGNVINTMPQGQTVTDIGFLITDESGNKYYFTSGEKVKTNIVGRCPSSGPLFNATEYYNVTWTIDKIETYNGKTIQYDYLEYIPYNVATTVSEEFLDVSANENCITNPLRADAVQSNKTRLIDKIHFPDLDIVFHYRNEPRFDLETKILHYISTQEKNNFNTWNNPQGAPAALEKIISFDQDYFDADAIQTGGVSPLGITQPAEAHKKLRLRLKEVRFGLSPNSRTLFSFDYFEPYADVTIGNNGVLNTPLRLNPCQDYWGYYTDNDIPQNNEVAFYIPTVTGAYSPYNIPQGINREPSNVNKTKLFALHTITNETKGCTEFFYGLNEANINGTVKKLDGLRIEEIHNYTIGMTDNTTKHITKYEYENGEWIVPETATYPNIKDLFKKSVFLHCSGNNGPGFPAQPVYTPNFTIYNNHFLGQLDDIQHGYAKVTVKSKKNYNTKDVANNQMVNETKETAKTENYFITMRNVPSGVLNMHGSSLSGNTFTMNTTNLVLNAPIPYTLFGGLTLTANTNYHMPYNSYPYTFKQYYIQWALGIPYKTVSYDVTGHKKSESVQEYDVYVKALNTDNYINLHGATNYYYDQPNTMICQTDKMKYDYYHPYTGRIELKKSTAKSYINDNDLLQKTIDYEYDNVTGYPRKTIETQANNAVVENREFYNSDNNNWNNNALMTAMVNDNVNKNIHSEVWRKEPGQNTFKLINASGSGFTNVNGKIRNNNSYHLTGKTLLVQSPIVTNNFTVADANAGNVISNFLKSSTTSKYDAIGNACEITNKGKYASYIYDFYQDAMLAEISNAQFNEVAYNSFESNLYESDVNNVNYKADMGNWSFDPKGINFTHRMTGNRCYNLGVQNVNIVTAEAVSLTPGKKYVISFWKKNNPAISIDNWKTAGGNYTSVPITYTAYQTNASNIPAINGWTYCEAIFTATYEKVKIFGTATDCFIDELRLYPADASMATKCFTPLYGKTTECDAFNQILRYEYNENERFHLTRDIKGNILSKTKTAVQSND